MAPGGVTEGNVLVALCALLGPLLLASLLFYQRRAERKEDYKRQDEVARKADENQQVTMQLLGSTDQKIDIVHSLVNSQLSAALVNELDALKRELAMLVELMAIKKQLGIEPTRESLEMYEISTRRIGDLTRLMEEREKQDVVSQTIANEKP